MRHFIRLSCVFLLCLLSSRFEAQTITIGTENNLDSADAGVLPFNPYYTYSYSQTIYLAEDIDAVDTIKAIQYHFKGTSLHNSRQLKIYMTTVQASEMTGWLLHSAFQKVFDGTIPDTSGDVWIRIPLDSPYVYYSRLNLAIAVDENSPSFDGDHDKFYFTNTPQNEGYRAMVLQDDVDNPEHGPLPTGEFQRAYANIKIEGMLYNCGKPKDPSVSSVKKDTTTISWLAPTKGPDAVRYIWRVLPKDIDVEDVAADSGTVVGLSAMVKGLRNGELYDFYVRTECDSNDYYRWTKALRFTAPCGPLSNFPFLEGFEGSPNLPLCWNQIEPADYNYAGVTWKIKEELPKTGNNSISLQTDVATENWLILPPFKLDGHQRLRYSQRIKKEYYNSNDSLFYTIKVSKTGRDSLDFTYSLTDTILYTHSEYRDTSHNLSAFVGDVNIAFVVPIGMNKTNKLY